MIRRVIVIVGATATGKTGTALSLASTMPAEAVSADSRQVYRHFDIGTAKPTAAERVLLPHHGIDIIEPTERFDAARFRRLALDAIDDICARGRTPIVVGGTGLYVRALLRGLSHVPPVPDDIRQQVREELAALGPEALHVQLGRVDAVGALRIHPRDPVRIARALEVFRASGRPLSAWQSDPGGDAPSFAPLVVGMQVEPAVLDRRIADRVERMLKDGVVDEVATLARSVAADAPAWGAVGYRELRAYVAGESSLDTARSAMVLATRQFAKRQRTWFRREPDVHWIDPLRDADRLRLMVDRFVTTGTSP